MAICMLYLITKAAVLEQKRMVQNSLVLNSSAGLYLYSLKSNLKMRSKLFFQELEVALSIAGVRQLRKPSFFRGRSPEQTLSFSNFKRSCTLTTSIAHAQNLVRIIRNNNSKCTPPVLCTIVCCTHHYSTTPFQLVCCTH